MDNNTATPNYPMRVPFPRMSQHIFYPATIQSIGSGLMLASTGLYMSLKKINNQ